MTLEFDDDLSDPKVQCVIVQSGTTSSPCKEDLTINLHSTTAHYPTPSFCNVNETGPVACPGPLQASTPPKYAADFVRGDTDSDGLINLTDVVVTLNFLFLSGPAPTCVDTADFNDDEELGITDPVFGLNFLFLGGLPIPPPSSCDPDLTTDVDAFGRPMIPPLTCAAYAGCLNDDPDLDGLSTRFEGIIGTDPGDPSNVCEDADGDGIPEHDVDGNGIIDQDELDTFCPGSDTDCDGFCDNEEVLPSGVNAEISLAFLQAHPLRPDVFLEIDWFELQNGVDDHTHAPMTAALQAVVESFNTSPVTTLVGGLPVSTGVTLHLDAGIADPSTGTQGVFNLPSSSVGGEAIQFISAAEERELTSQGSPQGAFAELRRFKFGDDSNPLNVIPPHFDTARSNVFHYQLWIHFINTNFQVWSGVGELPGQDSLISFTDEADTTRNFDPDLDGCLRIDPVTGDCICVFDVGNPPCTGGVRDPDDVRSMHGLFMHELGHNFGLRHGGFEDTTCKPNYNSIMNYIYSVRGVDTDCDLLPNPGAVGYSSLVYPTLDENNLIESSGICPTGPAIDWNCDGTIEAVALFPIVQFLGDQQCMFPNDGVNNCSGAPAITVSEGFDDWEFLSCTGFRRGHPRFFGDDGAGAGVPGEFCCPLAPGE